LYIADSIKFALGGHWEAIVWWSLNQIIALFHMPKCPITNDQFITSPTFFGLAVTKTYEMGAGIQVKASSSDVIYTVL